MLRRSLYVLWGLGLVVYLAYQWTAPRQAVPAAVLPFEFSDYLEAFEVVETGSRPQTVDLRHPSVNAVIVFASPTCSACIQQAERILEVLEALPGDHRMVLPSRPEEADEWFHDHLLVPAEFRFLPADTAAIRNLRVRTVPSFLVISGGRAAWTWAGVPSRGQLLGQRLRGRL